MTMLFWIRNWPCSRGVFASPRGAAGLPSASTTTAVELLTTMSSLVSNVWKISSLLLMGSATTPYVVPGRISSW